MSGICGSTADPEGNAVRAMSRELARRGPAGDRFYFDPDRGLALGARELSTDGEHHRQPAANEDGTVWAILDGSIYNHRALAEGLGRLGHVVRSGILAELLVHLYEEHGSALVHALDGTYAFAIWDRPRQRLLLARDRFGEKTLFYAVQGDDLVFASESGAVCTGLPRDPGLEAESISAFLALGYVPGELSIRQGVRQLAPAHSIVWSAARRGPAIERYWSLPDFEPASPVRLKTLAGEVADTLARSVGRRLAADEPSGVLLSGGAGSALVAAMASKIAPEPVRTFSVRYDIEAAAQTSRTRHVARVLGTQHSEITLTSDDVRERLPGLMARLDQPLGDPALLTLHAAAALAGRDVTVALGGHGAEDFFGGALRPCGPGQRLRELSRSAPVTAGRGFVTETRGPDIQRIWGPALVDDPDREPWLPADVMVMPDRAGMLLPLEVRAPFLDRTLAELITAIAPAPNTSGSTKRILGAIVARVAPDLRGGPADAGFRPPVADWLRGPLREALFAYTIDGLACQDCWLDETGVRHALEEHLVGTADHSAILWRALSLGLWLDAQ